MRVAAGESSARARDQVIDHLVACSDCAEEYRLITPLEIASQSAAEPRTIASSQAHAQVKSGSPWRGWFVGAFGGRIAYAAAAALIVVTALLAFWIGSLRRDNSELMARLERQARETGRVAELQKSLEQTQNQLQQSEHESQQREAEIAALRKETDQLGKAVGELSQLQVNAFVADIEPSDSVRGDRGSGNRTIVVPKSASLVTLILNLGSRRLPGRYSLEIVGDRGVISQGLGLRQSDENTFTIAISRRLLQSGQYRLKLYALHSGQRELVEDYAVRIEYR
jgi:hypothetical protein